MSAFTSSLILGAVLCGASVAQLHAEQADTSTALSEDCFAPVEPVVALAYGSRYTDDSKTRSDFDEDANAEVEKALEPVDAFVADLARESNRALTRDGERGVQAANCVFARIEAWAKVDALSDLGTMNAQISAPSRLGGIAFAYVNALRVAAPEPAQKAEIERWMTQRARAHVVYFNEEAPRRASRNNLRQWAGLAVALVGVATQDQEMIDWANETVEYTACHAEETGALPLEMERGNLSLHYQMHAVTPLVVTAALLSENSAYKPFESCDNGIRRIVDYTLAALEDPSIVEARTGEAQKLDAEPKSYDFAWATAYLKFEQSDELKDLTAGFDKLSNSKLGGDQSLIW